MSIRTSAKPAALLLVPVIYLIFTVTSALAGVIGLLSLLTGSTKPLGRITRAMDVLAAAQLSIFLPSWRGRETVSAECGRDIDCKFCAWLCSVLNWMEDRHCEEAADREDNR